MPKIELLDCTLRDGAYIVDGKFGMHTIGGIIKRLQEANVNIIECGWLKDADHVEGTTYYHTPNDLNKYLISEKNRYTTYVAMIDYNRYNIHNLPDCDGESIDAIRVVFPHGKVSEGVSIVKEIMARGYKAYIQAANTLAYSDYDLLKLVDAVNEVKPEGISIVDTFGAMYPWDLTRILMVINNNLEKDIKIGFHSHNNQQMSFALSMQFVQEMMLNSRRNIIIDGSLCGMGRGAGNTTTELMANYLNTVFHKDYDINIILDAIDVYMTGFQKDYFWGYSIPYLIAGMYECHVNNVKYLRDAHSIKNKDMKIIFSSMGTDDRRQYNYSNLEKVYSTYASKEVEDRETVELLKKHFEGKNVVVILPGKMSSEKIEDVMNYVNTHSSIVIGVNSVIEGYNYDYLFFTKEKKYEFAKENQKKAFENAKKIVTSNVRSNALNDEIIINYNDLQKYGWKYYDNSMVMLLRLFKRLLPSVVAISGFDGYIGTYNENYYPEAIKGMLSKEEMMTLQTDIEEMLKDFCEGLDNRFVVEFLTASPFESIFV